MNKRVLFYILIFPLLAYGGLKAYVWYTVKSNVDDVVANMTPFAEVTYDGIFSSLDGVVGIEGVVIKPVMTNDEFTLQTMSLSSESIFDFIDVGKRFNNGDFPKQMGWEAQKLKLDLDSKIFRLMSDFQQQAESTQPAGDGFLFERLDALGCGTIGSFGLDEFIDMGYNQLELDLAMEMKYFEISRQMQISLHMKDRDLYRADFDVRFALDIDKIKAGTMETNELAVTAMNVVYTDTGYHKLRNAFCAELNDGTEAAYIDANITQLGAELGGELPEKVVTEYRHFMAEGGTVEVNLSPAEATALSGMEFYETADAMRILGMSMSVNNVSVDADQIQWKVNADKAKRQPGSPASASVPATSAKISPPPTRANAAQKSQNVDQSSSEPSGKSIKVSQISRYVGEMVQIDTTQGKRRVGRLESADQERVRIMMKLGGGEFSFPVKLSEITAAKVFR